jgi:ribosome-associated translation inhibitor RaiA
VIPAVQQRLQAAAESALRNLATCSWASAHSQKKQLAQHAWHEGRSDAMQTPLRISLRELQSTRALESRIRDHLMRLERFHPPILHCHVIIDASAPHATKAAAVEITIDLKVPGCEICVRRTPNPAQDDLYVALRDAFDAAKRLLRDHARACECRGMRSDPDQQPSSQGDTLYSAATARI